MNCWHCKSELIWKGDYDYDECGYDGEGIVSFLICNNCPTTVEIYNDQ